VVFKEITKWAKECFFAVCMSTGGERDQTDLLILCRQFRARWDSGAGRVQWCLFCFIYLLISHHL